MSEEVRYGGQAVIEGVMMRGRKHFAVACRRLSGEVCLQKEPVPTFLRSEGWKRWPFVRGTVALVDSMVLGMKTLLFSANLAMEEIDPSDPVAEKAPGEKSSSQKVGDVAIPVAMVFSMILAIALFKLVPLTITQWLSNRYHIEGNINNVIDGAIRMAIFIGYLAGISRLPDIRRVFQYHGAEHKTINAYEAKDPLTVEAVQKHTTRHQRCGTTFILLVLVIQIILLLFTGWKWSFLVKFLVRIGLLVPVAGISYEIIRMAGKYKDSPFWNIVVAPGMWLQGLTTREPDDSQVEVAIASLKGVLEQESDETTPQEVVTEE
jgi:uncharacterized protein YqhQ